MLPPKEFFMWLIKAAGFAAESYRSTQWQLEFQMA